MQRNLTENFFQVLQKSAPGWGWETWNNGHWGKKKQEVLCLTLYFPCLWLSSWHRCHSGVLAVLGLWGRTGTFGGLWWAVVGWWKRKQPTNLEELGLLSSHFLIFLRRTSAHHRGCQRNKAASKSRTTLGNNSADFRRQKQPLHTLGLLMFLEKAVGRGLAGIWNAQPWARGAEWRAKWGWEAKAHEICQAEGQTWYLVENHPFSGHFWWRVYQHGFVSIPLFQSVELMLLAPTYHFSAWIKNLTASLVSALPEWG